MNTEMDGDEEDTMSEYPEHEKMMAVQSESQAIGNFIENGGYVLARWGEDDNRLWPVHMNINTILARHFGIDLDVIEKEKRAMLESLRAAN